jgi:hypothetical protein
LLISKTNLMSGGELAVKTGSHGEMMMENFLKAIGWTNLAKNAQFNCNLGSKHKLDKSKGERNNHNIDGIFHYDNPLNHQDIDVVLCSSKHNLDGYSAKNKIFEHLQELAYTLECAPNDYNFSSQFTDNKKDSVFKGVLFWVSSNDVEKNLSIINNVSDDILEDEAAETPRIKTKEFDSIYLVDNQKATFILSAVKTAESFSPLGSLKFLYPHTGRNNDTDKVMVAGQVMPVQYINSSLLPIVLEADRITVMLFCDEKYSSSSVKKMIWFAHKISGLANSIHIYYNDFDVTKHQNDVDIIKQSFKDSSLTNKIVLARTRMFDFVTLKEHIGTQELSQRSTSLIRIEKVVSSAIENSLDRYLPFGEMMRPIIDSTVLNDSDIKSFLTRKGIYLGNNSKTETVPLLSTLLLSPSELEDLKALLRNKEDKIKSVPRSAKLVNFDLHIDDLKPIVTRNLKGSLPPNCNLADNPILEDNQNSFKILYRIEKHNTTKDLISGKQLNDAALNFEIKNGELNVRLDYTTRESYRFLGSTFKKIEQALISNNFIEAEFFSIKFNLFNNNADRINFLLSFMNTSGSTVFNNAELEYIIVKPDNTFEGDIPFDLESLKNKVNELSIGGKDLDTLHYFSTNYKKALLMQCVRIKYAYYYGSEKGFCLLDLDFKNGLSEPDAELQCNLEIKKGKGNKGKNTEPARKFLLDKANEMIKLKYENRKKEQVDRKSLHEDFNN